VFICGIIYNKNCFKNFFLVPPVLWFLHYHALVPSLRLCDK
jgi:hypothetical protein